MGLPLTGVGVIEFDQETGEAKAPTGDGARTAATGATSKHHEEQL